MSLIVLLYFALRTDIIKITRVILPFFLLLLLPPVIDWVTTLGVGRDITYLSFTKTQPWVSFFSFFGRESGITLGMRIEIVIALCGIFSYLYVKRNNFILSLLYTCLAYELIFYIVPSPLLLCPLKIIR